MTSMHPARTVNHILYENRGEETEEGHICAQEAHCQDTFCNTTLPSNRQCCDPGDSYKRTFYPQNITHSRSEKRSQKTLLVTIYLK